MRLDYKKVLLVGLAFMGISIFWQMYDSIIPKMLINTFKVDEIWKGVIMALDNIFALVMLPLFGAISDKTSSKLGKRMPFVIIGTICAVICMIFIPVSAASKNLPMFFIALFFVLVAMSSYRSPAVALMPDVTPKPLRSKGNAVINLMGALGAVVSLGLIMFLYKDGKSYFPLFICIAIIMLGTMVLLVFKVKENKLVKECQDEMKKFNIVDEEESAAEGTPLGAEKKRSLIFILITIFFLFMGYNAVTTSYSLYSQYVLGTSDGGFASPLMVANIAAIIMFIPIGNVATKIGRKKTIIIGICGIIVAFLVPALFFNNGANPIFVTLVFVLAGFSWAAINVNTLVMVVEMSRGSTVGKYTGIYYSFSMSAQILTPILSSAFITWFGFKNQIIASGGQFADYRILFPYALVFIAIALFTMSLVKHGDAKPLPPKSRLEHFDVVD